jgi:hypothetical protein
MQNITTVAGLQNAIRVLEVDQTSKGQLLKEQLSVVYESLMPINILRNTLKKFFGKSDLIENLSGSAMGAASGLLLKNIFIGKSGNAFKKLIGSLLQMGISNFVAKNSDLIKSVGHGIIQYLFYKKPADAKSRVG